MTHNIQWFSCLIRADYKPGQVWSEAKEQENMMAKRKIDSKKETIEFTAATRLIKNSCLYDWIWQILMLQVARRKLWCKHQRPGKGKALLDWMKVAKSKGVLCLWKKIN